jgi:hypothetical protein
MKFLCMECDKQMHFAERREPGDGTFTVSFTCPQCGRAIAMLANSMETQLVGSLGVRIGGETLEESEPMGFVRTHVDGADRELATGAAGSTSRPHDGMTPRPRPAWSPAAAARLERVPGFVRGMVKRIYGEYAAERGIPEITPEIMDRARVELGLEEM